MDEVGIRSAAGAWNDVVSLCLEGVVFIYEHAAEPIFKEDLD